MTKHHHLLKDEKSVQIMSVRVKYPNGDITTFEIGDDTNIGKITLFGKNIYGDWLVSGSELKPSEDKKTPCISIMELQKNEL